MPVLGYLPPILPSTRTSPDLFDLREVDSSWSRRTFAGVPWVVYRGDPYWTPPLLADRRRALELRDPSGFAQPKELGLFYVESRMPSASDPATGSIAVWQETGGVRASLGGACFGMFEVINNPRIAEALFEAGETWLFEHFGRLRAVRGPMSLQPFRLPGVLVDGFGERPAAALPYTPPYYPDALEAVGYAPTITWSAYQLVLDSRDSSEQPGTLPRTAAAPGPNWSALRDTYAKSETALMPGLALCLQELAHDGVIRTEALSRQGRYIANRLCSRAITAALSDSRGVVACVALPDISNALRWMHGRLLPLGWIPLNIGLARTRTLHVYPPAIEGPGAALIEPLYGAAISSARLAGYQRIVFAPVAEGDAVSATALAGLGAHPTHRYAIFEKTF